MTLRVLSVDNHGIDEALMAKMLPAWKLAHQRWLKTMSEFTRRYDLSVQRLIVDPKTAESIQEMRYCYAPAGISLHNLELDIAKMDESRKMSRSELSDLADIVFSQWFSAKYQLLLIHNQDTAVHLWSFTGKARWAADGYPMVSVSAQVAASLCATGKDDNVETKAPWKCFMITVGSGLLDARVQWIMCNSTTLLRRNNSSGGFMVAVAQDGNRDEQATMLWQLNRTLPYLASLDVDKVIDENIGSIPFTGGDGRTNVVAGKIVAGVCTAMLSTTAVVRDRRGRRIDVVRQELKPGTYTLGLPVKCDLSPDVSAWVRGETKRMFRSASRWFVHGHWRNQVCGSGRQERRLTWIAPYWKGPERAAALVRPHIIDGRGGEQP